MENFINIFQNLSSPDPKIKYGSGKMLMQSAEQNPRDLYPHFDDIYNLIWQDNNIIKWNAIRAIGYLSKADIENKIDKVINEFYKLLNSGELITANNTIYALGDIAGNKPDLKEHIFNELIKVGSYDFPTEECKEIAKGRVLEVFKKFLEDIRNNERFQKFIIDSSNSSRNSTKKRAELLIEKFK